MNFRMQQICIEDYCLAGRAVKEVKQGGREAEQSMQYLLQGEGLAV
jgi:hypothetical protein